MKSNFVGGLLLAGCLAVSMSAQMPEGYLDVYVAKVKMGKRAEFDSLNKKEVDANRRNKGDNWLAYELTYGEGNTVYYVSARADYAAAADGLAHFEGAMAGAFGKSGMLAMFNAFDATLDSSRAELRRRRNDLSPGLPADLAAYNQLIGTARYLRTVVVHVRPGKALDYEAHLKLNKTASEKANPGVAMLVSQTQAGQPLGIYYITTFVKSLADFDKIKPLQEVLGSGYERYLKALAEDVTSTQILIGKFLPEISNPPDEIVAVDPKFWRPAPPPMAAKPAEPKK